MEYFPKSRWIKGLVGLTSLALAFNLVADPKDGTAYAASTADTESTYSQKLELLLKNIKAPDFKPADCSASPSSVTLPQPVLKRSLTENEFSFYSKLHGNAVDLTGVCIHLHKADASPATSPRSEKIINIFGQENYSEDYMTEKDPKRFGLLATEISQLLQSRTNPRVNAEDYVRFVFHPATQAKTGSCDDQETLIKTAENAWPGAQDLRAQFETRQLTDNEKAFVLGIFGDQISDVNLMTVRQHSQCQYIEPGSNKVSAASVTNNHKTEFNTWGRSFDEKDYSKSKIYNFGVFIHETTHEWQNQDDRKHMAGQEIHYSYAIDAKKMSFKDYHMEQQGAIIEDYARLFLHSSKRTNRLTLTEENLEGLKKIVEDQFPMAKKTRLYFDENGRLPDLPTVQGWLNAPKVSTAPSAPVHDSPTLKT